MTCLSFSKLIPGGNPTILLHDPLIEQDLLPDLSARLMAPLHLYAEQVGALYSGEADEWSASSPEWELPRLEMMGGEFCLNAARSAALCLARQGWLVPEEVSGGRTPVWGGKLKVSGADKPVPVLVASDAATLERAVACADGSCSGEIVSLGNVPVPEQPLLYCAAKVGTPSPARACAVIQSGATLVSLPGMSHLLVDAEQHPRPELTGEVWKKQSAAWRASCGMTDLPASGVVWYVRKESGYAIWPAIEVKPTATEHLESACGSASLAIALLHLTAALPEGNATGAAVNVRQPSGELLAVTVHEAVAEHEDVQAWVSGPVRLVAEGKVYA